MAFDRVGGFDERNLAPNFNDVDLCIRLRKAGYRIIWTPHACLRRQGRKERGLRVGSETSSSRLNEIAHMRDRWGQLLDHDPYWNPNLSLKSNDPQVSLPPRIARPWNAKASRPQ
jgi:GT2 family glycosyltransferase